MHARVGASMAAVCALAVAAFALYADAGLNVDSMWSLAWGQQLARGVMPDFSVGPTPHPLPNALAVLLAPLGASGELVVSIAGWIAGGAAIYATGLIAGRLFGLPAGLAAAALMLTLRPVMDTVSQGLVDVPFAALVLGAVALELRRPRCGTATLAILAVAGLLRPEAWLLSGLY
jgi:hypothetical protein